MPLELIFISVRYKTHYRNKLLLIRKIWVPPVCYVEHSRSNRPAVRSEIVNGAVSLPASVVCSLCWAYALQSRHCPQELERMAIWKTPGDRWQFVGFRCGLPDVVLSTEHTSGYAKYYNTEQLPLVQTRVKICCKGYAPSTLIYG